MQCDRAAELVGAYLDQELDAQTRREVAAHLAGCPACAAVADDLNRMSRQLSAMGRVPAPEHLVADVRKRLGDTPAEAGTLPRIMPVGRLPALGWLRQAAAVLLLCGLTAAGTGILMSRTAGTATLGQQPLLPPR